MIVSAQDYPGTTQSITFVLPYSPGVPTDKSVVKDQHFIRKQEGFGATVITDARNDPAGHINFVMSEVAKWAPVIRTAGVYAD